MRSILWLTSWYPNATDPFNGDFIKRQAEAVSLYQPLKILFVVKNHRKSLLTGDYPDIHNRDQNLEEHILYYSSTGSDRSVLS